MTQVPPPEHVAEDLVHERVTQMPRTLPASTGRQAAEKRPVQSMSVTQVEWQDSPPRPSASRHAVPEGQAPASPHEAAHSCCTKPEVEEDQAQLSPLAQPKPSVHGSPCVRS